MVLKRYNNIIPAGTPFIMHAEEVQHGGGSNSIVSFPIVLGDDGRLAYSSSPTSYNGLQGTLCKAATIAANKGCIAMASSQLYLTSETAQTVIGAGSGYLKFAFEGVEESDGEVTLDLPSSFTTPTFDKEWSGLYQRGEKLTSAEAMAAAGRFVMYATGSMGEGYMNGGGEFTSNITTDNFLSLEEATGTTTDGYQAYRLKQTGTNEYLADYALTANADDSSDNPPSDAASGQYIAFTPDASEALSLIIVTAQQTDATDLRTYATEGTGGRQSLTDGSLVFSRSGKIAHSEGQAIQYFGHFGNPVHSIYTDTNAWDVYSVEPLSGYNLLMAIYNKYFGEGQPSDLYQTGDAPGQYIAAYVETAQALYDKAAAQKDNYTYSDDETFLLCYDIKQAMEALESDNARNPMKDGYYVVHNPNDRYLCSKMYGEQEFVYSKYSDTDIVSPLTKDNANNLRE